MKRFLSVLMASVLMVLTLSTGLTAMAESYTGTSIGTQQINAKYSTSTTTLDKTVKIEITWPSLVYTYKDVKKEVWNSSTHTVDTVQDTSATGWDKADRKITVKNNSAIGVKITMSYRALMTEGKMVTLSGLSGVWIDPGKSATATLSMSGDTAGTKDTTMGQITTSVSTS